MKNKISKLIFALMVPAMFVVGLFCCLNPFSIANATTIHGGAIYVGKGSLYTMNGGEISNAKSEYGGGVMVVGGNFNFQNGTIYNNSAVSWHGGGVYVWDNGQMTMTNGIIRNNTSTYAGGGIMISDNSTVRISGGQIINNTANTRGGGVCVGVSSVLYFSGGTISGNTANNVGGGVLIDETSTMQMTGGTICDNTSTHAGADLYNYGTFTMSDGTIGKENSTSNADAIVNEGAMSIYGGNVYDNISNAGTIYTKMAANINGTIAITNENARIIVEDWGGTVPSYTVKPLALDKVFMILKGGDSEPDLSTLTINGFTLSDKIYLKSQKNADGDWEICVSERISNVTFNPTRGTCETESINVGYGEEFGTLPTPYLRGYKFTGWSRNYFSLTNYTGSYQGVASAGKITLTPAKTNTRAGFQIQMWNNDSLIETDGGTMLWANSTGHFSTTFTKTEELKQIYFRLNADADDAYVIYDIQDLVNGHTYVVSLDVTEFGLNKIVVENVMIEENSLNQETTYTSSCIKSTTINDQLCSFTLFAHYSIATIRVRVSNLSGTNSEGGVMGTTQGVRSYVGKKLGDTITISYKPNGKYTFAKVVKGTAFESPEITDLNYTITEEDLNESIIYFTICYTVSVNLYADGDGKVSINNQTLSGSAQQTFPYTGPTINDISIHASVGTSGDYVFDGWFGNPNCYGLAKYIVENNTITGIDGNIYLWAKFLDINTKENSYREYFVFNKNWFDIYKQAVDRYVRGFYSIGEVSQMRMIQFRSDTSLNSQLNNGTYSSRLKCKHNKSFTINGSLADAGSGNCEIKYKACDQGTCVIFYTEDSNMRPIYAGDDMSSCFVGMTQLSNIVFENFDTRYTKNMSDMFNGCSNLSALDLSVFNTRRVMNFDRMFYNCNKLSLLNLSNFEIKNRATTENMLSFNSTGFKCLYTPKVCEKNITIPKEMYDYANSLYANFNIEKEYGPYTVLPLGEQGSRYYFTNPVENSLYYITITSDILSSIVTVCEIGTNAEIKIKFDFNEPLLWFHYEALSIHNSSGKWESLHSRAYFTQNNKVFEITIVPDSSSYYFQMNESALFSTFNESLNNKGIKLTELQFLCMSTDRMEDMSSLFENCSDLTYVKGLQNLHYMNVRSANSMFAGCDRIEEINMANCDFDATANTMFSECNSLTVVDLSNNESISGKDVFSWCRNLNLVILPPWCSITVGENIATYVFVDLEGNVLTKIEAHDRAMVIVRKDTKSLNSNSESKNRLLLNKEINTYSAFAMICVSALAYPFMNKKRKQRI